MVMSLCEEEVRLRLSFVVAEVQPSAPHLILTSLHKQTRHPLEAAYKILSLLRSQNPTAALDHPGIAFQPNLQVNNTLSQQDGS